MLPKIPLPMLHLRAGFDCMASFLVCRCIAVHQLLISVCKICTHEAVRGCSWEI